MSLQWPWLILSIHRLRFHIKLLCLKVDPFAIFFSARSFSNYGVPPSTKGNKVVSLSCHFLLVCASLSRTSSVLLGMYDAYRTYPNLNRLYGHWEHLTLLRILIVYLFFSLSFHCLFFILCLSVCLFLCFYIYLLFQFGFYLYICF